MYRNPDGVLKLRNKGFKLIRFENRHDDYTLAVFDNGRDSLYIVAATEAKFNSILKLDEALDDWKKKHPKKIIADKELIDEGKSSSNWIFEPEVNEPEKIIMARSIKYQ